MSDEGAAEALRQAASALGEAADAIAPNWKDDHDEFCEWGLDEYYEDDCHCLGRRISPSLEEAKAKEEAKKEARAKARATAKTPKGPREHVSAKRVRLAAEALGFECWSVPGDPYVKPASYYASTTDNYKEGDLKSAEKEFPRWRLRGRHLAIPDELAFDCSWADGFMGGRIIDPAGKEVELRANYHYSPSQAKNLGYTTAYAEKVGQERTARYNDGGTSIRTRWEVKTFEELTLWIDDLIKLLKVDYEPITTKKRVSKKKTEEEVMQILLNPKVEKWD